MLPSCTAPCRRARACACWQRAPAATGCGRRLLRLPAPDCRAVSAWRWKDRARRNKRRPQCNLERPGLQKALPDLVFSIMPEAGLEPARARGPADFESAASTSSATPAYLCFSTSSALMSTTFFSICDRFVTTCEFFEKGLRAATAFYNIFGANSQTCT